MRRDIIIFASTAILLGCPVAHSYDVPAPTKCVIDMCEDELCVVETPEGVVEITRLSHYTEGMSIECPIWLIDPT